MHKSLKYILITASSILGILAIAVVGLLLYFADGIFDVAEYQAPPLPDGTAEYWNKSGLQLYKKGKYEEALENFSISIRKKPDYHYPIYNYACTKALYGAKLDIAKPCYEDLTDIIQHLKKTISLKPKYLSKIRKDPDLNYIRDTFMYHQLIGFNTVDQYDIESILKTVSWGSDDQGARGSGYILNFEENGIVNFKILDCYFDKENCDVKYINVQGKYSVKGKNISLQLDQIVFGSNKGSAELTKNGLLLNLGSLVDLVFTDSIVRCDG